MGPEEATLHLTAISDLLTLTNESSQELFVYLQRTAQCICWALHAVFAYTRDLHQRPTPETYLDGPSLFNSPCCLLTKQVQYPRL